MYQVFDTELFELPPPPPLPPLIPPVDYDYTVQQRGFRDPGDGIDEVFSWFGLGIPSYVGAHMGETADDPGGGWGCLWGSGGEGGEQPGRRGTVGGQLMMEMERDEYDYVDYNCFSSGLTSPDLDSEFFVRPGMAPSSSSSSSSSLGAKVDAGSVYHPWESGSGPFGASLDHSELRHSPLFHQDAASADFRLPDCVFAGAQFEAGHVVQGEFDLEAEAKVKEIARYLASFEVQSWPNSELVMVNSSIGNGVSSPFASATSVVGSNGDHMKTNASTNKVNLSADVFHPGYDDTCSGLESTMVNPNEVFPDRVDRSDHQYASRPSHRPPQAARLSTTRHHHPPPAPSRTHLATKPAVSVLEALLRSSDPIDPNKGSGAAVGLEIPDDSIGFRLPDADSGGLSTDGVLKKLLTERMTDDDVTKNPNAIVGDVRRDARGTEEHGRSFSSSQPYFIVGSTGSDVSIRSGQGFGYGDKKTASRQQKLGGTMKRQEDLFFRGIASRNGASELMRFL